MSDHHNICLLNDSFPPTIDGVANAVLNYAEIIEHSWGHSVVMTPQVPDTVDNYSFPVVRYPSLDTRKLIGYVTGYPFSPKAAHAIESEKIDLLHTHCPVTSCLLARQLSESSDLPLVLTWHTKYDIDIANAVSSKMLQEGALQALLRNVNACDEVWTVSRGAGENLRSIGYEGDYIVMPNGVDLPHEPVSADLIRQVTGDYDLPDDVPCYLFIGRLMWYKGLRIILDALRKLSDADMDYRMVFVGGGGDEQEVRAYTEELGLSGRVFFTGALSGRDSLRAWYARADLFLFPSTFDTNGLVVREAAASDTASVIIEGSCASEGVTGGRNGFLIEENAESLAAVLQDLSASPELVRTVGYNAGHEIYVSWEDAVSRAYERYETVIDGYRSGKYPHHDQIRGSWMQSQGELMQILGNIGAAGSNLLHNAQSLQSGIESRLAEAASGLDATRSDTINELESRRHEVMEDLRSVRSEFRDELDSMRSSAAAEWESVRKDIRGQMRNAGDELWKHLERYL